jgi:uncharacterized protein
MKISGEHTFQAPRAIVWQLLQDPEVLAKAMPGTRRLEQTADGVYEGVIKIGVGPVTAAEWALTVTLSDLLHPESYTMTMDAKGALGFTRGSAQVHLDEQEGVTRMSYTSDMQIGGRVAGIGQRMLEQVGKMMTKQGLDALGKELEARLAADGG